MTEKHKYSEVQRAIADAANIIRKHRSKDITISIGGSVYGSAIGVNSAIDQIPSHANSLDIESLGLKDKLLCLEKSIEGDPLMSKFDKEIALEQLKIIAEATQNPHTESMKSTIRKAHMTLKGMAIAMPSDLEIVDAINDLSDVLTKVLAV
ncbi:hypothetical protein Pse7367_0886 [Thalassoporum mexicanum PCC 7367]|uniref:hypothetical protein n=1 Tax=Thalassoporum mexicanum TaxID=3457544 RepID=UPI00029F8173|nr:hypothetical protein [Pseudanabaena sp. PCC 7367]AFY69186.1 hypothetical protein Pse7367_0886 [Pseudanabaena sp. PCC 7367]